MDAAALALLAERDRVLDPDGGVQQERELVQRLREREVVKTQVVAVTADMLAEAQSKSATNVILLAHGRTVCSRPSVGRAPRRRRVVRRARARSPGSCADDPPQPDLTLSRWDLSVPAGVSLFGVFA